MNAAQPATGRQHGFDQLRAIAMMAGVLFHASLAYSPLLHGFWLTADASHSVWVDLLAWFSHLFRMPLFFVVAGCFTAALVSRHGLGGMLRLRARRVLLPLLVLWPVLHVAMERLTMQAIVDTAHPSPMMRLIQRWSLQADAPPVPPSLMHLWFLCYLLAFGLLVWVMATLDLKLRTGWLANARLRTIVCAAPLALLPALMAVPAPMPAPDSPLPQWWALLFFGLYFHLGYQLPTRRTLAAELKPIAPWLVLGAVACHLVGAWLWDPVLAPAPADAGPRHLLLAALQAYAGWWMVLWCLHAGSRWLDTPRPLFRYLADASYWVYLIHLPVIFAIQFPLLDLALAWPWKLALTVAATVLISLGSYQLLVRRTLLGHWLNGWAPAETVHVQTGTSALKRRG